MNPPPKLDFDHRFIAGSSAQTLLLLHGTGGDENDLIPLGRALNPEAALLSPRGKVLENGRPRFFRRLAEGVFDEEDLKRRTHELADFIAQAAEHYRFAPANVLAVGYSNGANIASSLLLLRPGVIRGAALLRPMIPFHPETLADLGGAPVLLLAGNQDPIVPADEPRALADLLRRAGAEVALAFEDAGHGLTPESLDTVKKWLAALTN